MSTTHVADPADVKSIDAIIRAVYDVISGPAGEKRDWDRFQSLFSPEARLIPLGGNADGMFAVRAFTPDDYRQRSGPYLEKNGFFESEIARTVEQFGHIAHAFSTYESRHLADDAEPFSRGINSIQLMNDGKRWWVLSIYWESERPDNPIPKKYLP